jgi:Fe2+ or Zn2+ uptake regulation protein
MRTPNELTQSFRARGLKSTPQRQAIFAYLHDHHTHPTAESVYAALSPNMPSLSLRTVYQTLNDLVALGELSSVRVEDRALHFDQNTEEHHHGICDSCGAISDIYCDNLPSHWDFPAFQATSFSLVFRGSCAVCVEEKNILPHKQLQKGA